MPADRETATFDYGVPAELFMAKRKAGARQPLRYRRFATAAEAIRFAVEELPAMRSLGAWMQVGDQRFDGAFPHPPACSIAALHVVASAWAVKREAEEDWGNERRR